MAYYDHEPESGEDAGALGVTNQLLRILVRLLGLGLLLVGLWAGVKVVLEAWYLYQQPERIERFARAIERGSNMDRALSRLAPVRAAEQPDPAGAEVAGRAAAAPESDPAESFRLSYFIAWVIAILLLMLVGRLALGAAKTGGELVLYDTQVKQLARTLLRQVGRQK